MGTDVRHALRSLRRTPGFTLVVILSLALGIGLNTAIFSVVDGVLLRPTPVRDLDRLVMVWETDRNTGTTREPASLPDFLDFERGSGSFDTLASLIANEGNLTPPSGDPVRLAALRATHDLLPALGITPLLGRTFTEAEDRINGPQVVVISESLWARLFDRDPGAIGRVIRLDDVPHEVIGVVADTTDFGVLQLLSAAAYSRSFADRGVRTRVDVWTPLQGDPEDLVRATHPLFMIGRLAEGATVSGAQTELAAIAADLERQYPENAGRGVFVEPLADVVFGPVRPALLVLWAAVALVLLVAGVNVANLLLARGSARVREVAVRTSLGARTWTLARQFVIEMLVLTLAAASLGVALAYGALAILMAQAPATVPRVSAVTIDVRVLALTALVSVAIGVLFGLVPTLQALRVDPQSALKGQAGRQGTGGRGARRLRGALVVAELALAVILVIGAGLLIKSFSRLLDVDPGFAAAGVIKAEYQLPRSRYPADFRFWPDFKEQHAFTSALLDRAAALPGVEVAAIAGNHPLDPGFTNSFSVVGRPDETLPEISVRRVTPGYFRAVGLRLEAGRLLAESDDAQSPAVAVINESAARRLFGEPAPLGQQIRFWGANRTIVGVVRNELFQGITEAPPIAAYLPLSQAPSANGAGVLLLQTSGDPMSLASAARGAIREIDPALAVFGVEPLAETLARSIGEQRFTMRLLGLFALMALTLAAVGVHGVLSYNVAGRTQEIGIRMALGALPARVRRQVMGEGLAMAGIGVTIGVAGALALSRVLDALLFGVTATDPLTFAAVIALLALVACLATIVPAMRATRVNPVEAMRVE